VPVVLPPTSPPSWPPSTSCSSHLREPGQLVDASQRGRGGGRPGRRGGPRLPDEGLALEPRGQPGAEPGRDGEIALPENYLWVANAYWLDSGPRAGLRARRKLYNRDDHTFTFSDSVSLDMVLKLEWEEMPEYARQYITIAAAELFQARLQGSSIVEKVTGDRRGGQAWPLVEQREDEADEKNSIGGNRYVESTCSATVA
jgi:hypothetical protein